MKIETLGLITPNASEKQNEKQTFLTQPVFPGEILKIPTLQCLLCD